MRNQEGGGGEGYSTPLKKVNEGMGVSGSMSNIVY